MVVDAIELDSWKKMNVHYAKVVFSYEVICYQLNLLKNEIQLSESFFDKVIYDYKDKIGYAAELSLEMVDLLEQRCLLLVGRFQCLSKIELHS